MYTAKTLFLRFCTDVDDRCDFCGAEREDAVHLFFIAFIVLNYTAVRLLFNCIYSKHFWIDLEGLLCKYLDTNVYFSEKDVFFYFNKDYHKM